MNICNFTDEFLPVRYLLDMKSILNLWKWKNNLVPALTDENRPSTAQLRSLEITAIYLYTMRCASTFMRNVFPQKPVPL